jgi:transposase InsO family protein
VICHQFGHSRQAYYKHQSRLEAQAAEEQQIIARVLEIRKKQPMLGTRKLQHLINAQREAQRVVVGRDRLYSLLRWHHLLVRSKKKHVKTTNSYHRFRVYQNMIKHCTITRPDQVYVSDITYIATNQGFCYLSLITDAYSRKIVGYCLSRSLSIEGCITALKMALKGVKHPEKLVHHSDRGLQYCSHSYVELLEEYHVKISMTEENHAYENAIAERVNGILKNEFMLGERLVSFEVARKLVAESVKIYNNDRPHLSLNYRTPNDVHNSNVDSSKVINIESTSYPHKKGTYQHISTCLNLLNLNTFFQ